MLKKLSQQTLHSIFTLLVTFWDRGKILAVRTQAFPTATATPVTTQDLLTVKPLPLRTLKFSDWSILRTKTLGPKIFLKG